MFDSSSRSPRSPRSSRSSRSPRSSSVLAAQLEGLLVAVPGTATVQGLDAVPVESLSPHDAVTFLQVVAQAQSWLESLTNRALVAAAGSSPDVLEVPASAGRPVVRIHDVMREEIAAALGLAPATAQCRIDNARVLARVLPATCASLADGRLSPMAARVIAESLVGAGSGLHLELDDIDPAVAASYEARVLPTAERSPVGRTRTHARRVLRSLHPAGAAERCRRARATRDVLIRHEDDGISTLSARLGAEDAHRLASHLDTLACNESFAESLDDPDSRLIGVRRAAALAALVEAGAALTPPGPGGGPAAGKPRPAEVQLVMDLPTWLGLGRAPVEVLGGGLVPAELARELAASGTVRRLLTDPLTGALLDYGRRTYAVPEPLRDFLQARDRRCRAPGCSRRASACQIDHVVPWSEGGTTAPCNTTLLCTRHHQIKTHGGWAEALRDDSSCVWRSPHGRTHVTAAAPLVPPATTVTQAAMHRAHEPPPF